MKRVSIGSTGRHLRASLRQMRSAAHRCVRKDLDATRQGAAIIGLQQAARSSRRQHRLRRAPLRSIPRWYLGI